MELITVKLDNFRDFTFKGTRLAFIGTNDGISHLMVRYYTVYKTLDNQYVCTLVEHVDGMEPRYKGEIYISKHGILEFFGKNVVSYRIMWLVNDYELDSMRKVA